MSVEYVEKFGGALEVRGAKCAGVPAWRTDAVRGQWARAWCERACVVSARSGAHGTQAVKPVRLRALCALPA